MVGIQEMVRGAVGNAELGLGRGGRLRRLVGSGVARAVDGTGATGATEVGGTSGLGDGDGDSDGSDDEGDASDAGGDERAASGPVTVTVLAGAALCPVSTMTSIITPASTATPIAPTTAMADRKLTSSIQPYSVSRSRLPLTIQHNTGD